jgi:hypothetical protein
MASRIAPIIPSAESASERRVPTEASAAPAESQAATTLNDAPMMARAAAARELVAAGQLSPEVALELVIWPR